MNIRGILDGKIKQHTAQIGVVGLGYVGLPLAVESAKAGYQTTGFDIQKQKVNMVNAAENYIDDVINEDLHTMIETKKLFATVDFSSIKDMDFIAICVPTPLDRHQQPDISYVSDCAYAIAKYLRRGTIVVLESTTYPGTTTEVLRPILEKESGLKCGDDFYLGFSPERVDPGNLYYKTKNTPKVVGGIGKEATEIIASVYRNILESDIYEVSSPAVAEMEKILENTYRNINIALVNELTMLCNKLEINIWEVIDAAKTKPYGFQAFYPGPGLGGHCIPLDPYYLAWKAREVSFHTSMIESAGMINDRMPGYCVDRCSALLNRFRKSINGAKVLILGVAYKQDVNDYRESPALKVIADFEKRGAELSYYDKRIPVCEYKNKIYNSVETLTAEVIKNVDIVVVTTAHSDVDYQMVQKHAIAIFDTRNVMKDIITRDNIETL